MAQVIFVRTRHVYTSYIDFWRLVECSAQFKTLYIDEIDLMDDQAVYIFTPMNGEIIPKLSKTRRAKVIWWHLERPGVDPTTHTHLDKLEGLIDAIWVSDRWAVTLDSRFTYAFMASDRRIASAWTRDGAKMPTFDVATLANLWGRRQACVSKLAGLGVRFAPQAWGRAEQDDVLSQTRLILNLHQDENAPMVAPLRFAVAAAYSIPIISEALAKPQLGPFIEAKIDYIPEHVVWNLRDGKLAEQGANLFKRFCEQTDFAREVNERVVCLLSR